MCSSSSAVDHASLYLLELYPNAPLRDEMARGRLVAGAGRRRRGHVSGRARASGRRRLTQYEISNVARGTHLPAQREVLDRRRVDGLRLRRARHAQRPPLAQRVIDDRLRGAGDRPAGGGRRGANPRSSDRAEEALFTGLRLTAGLDLRVVEERYGVDVWKRYGDALAPFVESRVLEYTPPVLRLTRAGMLLANEVCAVFV